MRRKDTLFCETREHVVAKFVGADATKQNRRLFLLAGSKKCLPRLEIGDTWHDEMLDPIDLQPTRSGPAFRSTDREGMSPVLDPLPNRRDLCLNLSCGDTCHQLLQVLRVHC